MPQILCKDVVLGYEGNVVVRHLNFEVNRETICVLSGRTVPEKAH